MSSRKIADTVAAIDAWQERTDVQLTHVRVPVGWIVAMREELVDASGGKPWKDESAWPVLVILGVRVVESEAVTAPVCECAYG